MKYNISQKFNHVANASLPLALTSLIDNSTLNAVGEDNIYHNVTESIAAVLNATEAVRMDDYESSTVAANVVNQDPSECYQVPVDCNSSNSKIRQSNLLRAPSTPIITIEIVRMKRQLNYNLVSRTSLNYFLLNIKKKKSVDFLYFKFHMLDLINCMVNISASYRRY